MTDSKDIFVVFVYCDYRKEVDIMHIKAFMDRNEAIMFAKKYAVDNKKSVAEYVCIEGTEYDSKFWYPDDEDDEVGITKHENMRKELNLNKKMWHLRIAVSKIKF